MAEAHWHPKREARRFEPPPWELEQFETLRKRNDEAQAAEAARCEQVALPDEAEDVVAARPAVAAEAAPADKPADKPAKPKGGLPIPEAQVQTMLIQLGAEEPRVDQHLRVVGVFGSAVAMFFGLCMFVWGVIAFAMSRGQLAAVVGSMIVLGMGLVFGITGLWFGLRVTRQGD